MSVKEFRKEKAWQIAHRMVLSVYGATKRTGRDEYPLLTANIRATATEIAATIAVAYACHTKKESTAKFKTALNLAAQLESYLWLTRDLGGLDLPTLTLLLNELQETRTQINAASSKGAFLNKDTSPRPMPRGKVPF